MAQRDRLGPVNCKNKRKERKKVFQGRRKLDVYIYKFVREKGEVNANAIDVYLAAVNARLLQWDPAEKEEKNSNRQNVCLEKGEG